MAVSAELGKPLEAVLNELVKSGRYQSRSEVLREGVRLVQEREARLEAITDLVKQGQIAAREGRVRSVGDVFDDLDAKLHAMKELKNAG